METNKPYDILKREVVEAMRMMKDQQEAAQRDGKTFGERVHKFRLAIIEEGKWWTLKEKKFLAQRVADKMRWIYGGRYPR